jgi:hypothetical protein
VLQFLSPPTSVVRNDLKKQVTIEKPIHDLPGCDILDFFGEKLEMRILLLPEQFDRKLEDSFRKRSCTLASGTKEAGAWIDSVLLQMRGRMVVRNEAIVVVPGIGKAN